MVTDIKEKIWGVRHRLESCMPSWDSRIWNLALAGKLYNLRYSKILHLKIFHYLIWNSKLPGISNKDFKDSESRILLYFVMDPLRKQENAPSPINFGTLYLNCIWIYFNYHEILLIISNYYESLTKIPNLYAALFHDGSLDKTLGTHNF